MYLYKIEDVSTPDENFSIFRQLVTAAYSIDTHLHEFVEIVYIQKGEGVHYINDREYPVKRGDLLFINYGQTHSLKTDTSMDIVNLMLKPEFIGAQLVSTDNTFEILTLTAFEEFQAAICSDSPLVRFSSNDLVDVENLMSGIYREYQNKALGYKTVLRSYITALLTHIFRKMTVLGDSLPYPKGIITPELMDYIEAHSAEKITLNLLAEKCFYNPSYFSRIFKEYSGFTLTDFIHNNRIKNACELLKTTKLSVDEICSQVGYTDKTMFYKHFKNRIGQSPAVYRKSR